MKMVLERRNDLLLAKFVEGPRWGFYASENIGKPDERALQWPDRASALLWMQWQGHELYAFDPVAYLKERTTRELMNLRTQCYKFPDDGYDVIEEGSGHVVSLAQVLAELNTREHVPNKAEAKVIRQARAHAQRHR